MPTRRRLALLLLWALSLDASPALAEGEERLVVVVEGLPQGPALRQALSVALGARIFALGEAGSLPADGLVLVRMGEDRRLHLLVDGPLGPRGRSTLALTEAERGDATGIAAQIAPTIRELLRPAIARDGEVLNPWGGQSEANERRAGGAMEVLDPFSGQRSPEALPAVLDPWAPPPPELEGAAALGAPGRATSRSR
ncbi:MAG: hypothetical protein OEY14_02065 [Myxococcales bacterium]|nr:hypothetical protein [Myxococcales bacterium]